MGEEHCFVDAHQEPDCSWSGRTGHTDKLWLFSEQSDELGFFLDLCCTKRCLNSPFFMILWREFCKEVASEETKVCQSVHDSTKVCQRVRWTKTGLVTLKDILEEIVGEAQDEFDTRGQGVRPEVERLSDGTFSVDGLMPLTNFADQFNIKPPLSSAQTIGGYVFERLDRLPKVGDHITLEGYNLSVEELDYRRIARVLVQR